MNHLSEEELILHYYGEEGDSPEAELHLDECAECRELYGSLQRVLNVVDSLPVPEMEPDYGAQVWRRIERHVPARRRRWFTGPAWRWAAAGTAFAGLLVAAFTAGRFYQRAPAASEASAASASMAKADPAAHEKILLVAVGDYLERSQMVLIELANANPKASLDISAEQERAGDLVSESRLYRQTAAHTGDTAVSNVLDDVDRVLMDIARGPSQLSPAELENVRRRLEAEGILLKIRVLSSNVRNHEGPEAQTAAGQKL
jgi:hypothetical protein